MTFSLVRRRTIGLRTTSLLSSLGILLAGGVLTGVTAATAGADPATTGTTATGAATVHRDSTTPGLTDEESDWRVTLSEHPEVEEVWTYSPSMNRNIPLLVRPSATPDAPTLYLLNGVDGGKERNQWFGKGGAVEFFADKDVNLVMPVDGKNSYYSDWYSSSTLDRADRGGRIQQWATYLAEELPGPLEDALDANGVRAVLGMSMSATSALQLVEDNPGFYSAAAAISGCYDTTSRQGRQMVDVVVGRDGSGATAEELWGPVEGDAAHANNPALHLDQLTPEVQGTRIPLYFSASTGVPTTEEAAGISQITDPVDLATSVVFGPGLEIGAKSCTVDLEHSLAGTDVDATFNYPAHGLHSWAHFASELPRAWPTLSRGLAVQSPAYSL
jgi:S-formylglutathione hydrolase FrmB